ncbi:putative tail fiber protein [Rhizobium phage RHph_I1_18]|nr:putative tail fiber protein [Rhizobium phage RHph_I1_18]
MGAFIGNEPNPFTTGDLQTQIADKISESSILAAPHKVLQDNDILPVLDSADNYELKELTGLNLLRYLGTTLQLDYFLDCVPSYVSTTSVSFSSGFGFFGGKKHVLPAYTKTASAWAAGNNAGMLDTGTIGVSKTYFVFAIRNTTTAACDYLMSLSLTSPTVPAGYEMLSGSRVAILLTNSSSVFRQFAQSGNTVTMSNTQAFTTTASITQALFTLPAMVVGLSVDALLDLESSGQQNSDSIATWAHAYDQDGVVVRNRCWGPSGVNSNGTMSSPGKVRTNTSAQVYRYVSVVGSTTVLGYVRGWVDYQCKRLFV